MAQSDFVLEFKRFLVNGLIAGVSAAVAKTLTAPIDRVKLILQNQDSALQILKGERKRYNGIIDCMIRIPKEQGFYSLWRGNGTNILRYFPMQALNFAFNDIYSKHLTELISGNSEWKSTLIKFLAGGFAGASSITLLYPLELCQTRIAVDIGGSAGNEKAVAREFYGLGDCIRKIKKKSGLAGLYGGFGVVGVGVTLYRAVYFGMFDFVKHLWTKYKPSKYADLQKPPVLIGLALAQGTIIVSGVLTYPLDTLGRRLMLDAGRPKELRLFKSKMDAARVLYNTNGIRTFYKGVLANCARGLSGALVLVFYDEILDRAKKKKLLTSCDNC